MVASCGNGQVDLKHLYSDCRYHLVDERILLPQIERCCEMVLARGNREPSQALTGAALSGVLLCEYHFVTAFFGLNPQLKGTPAKIVGAKTFNLRYNGYVLAIPTESKEWILV